MSRPLLIAMIVILAGGAYLFWPRGGGAPSGIGEQHTVVTADSALAAAPRSGSVEIQDEVQEIVPEKPAAGGPAEAVREAERVPDAGPASQPAPARTPPRQEAKPARSTDASEAAGPESDKPLIAPRPSGAWAVQIGAFQTEANAQNLVDEMAAAQIAAHVRAAGTPSGEIVYRVWVGWFASRQEALDYGTQERRKIGESYPVHR